MAHQIEIYNRPVESIGQGTQWQDWFTWRHHLMESNAICPWKEVFKLSNHTQWLNKVNGRYNYAKTPRISMVDGWLPKSTATTFNDKPPSAFLSHSNSHRSPDQRRLLINSIKSLNNIYPPPPKRSNLWAYLQSRFGPVALVHRVASIGDDETYTSSSQTFKSSGQG